ncbi:MAG: hypothetical protein HGA80_00830 [Candidatus Omnitrophica bacterium]|nr:hypothetical protein [Candidatus Omnitrophota bacterium]
MQDTINLSVTPLQAILALAFQLWIVVFPFILMRKIDRLTALLEDHLGGGAQEDEEQDADQGNGEA